MNHPLLQKIIDYGLLFTLIIFPLSINISLLSPKDMSHPIIAMNISIADMLIGCILLMFCFKLTLYKEWKQVKMPPIQSYFLLELEYCHL